MGEKRNKIINNIQFDIINHIFNCHSCSMNNYVLINTWLLISFSVSIVHIHCTELRVNDNAIYFNGPFLEIINLRLYSFFKLKAKRKYSYFFHSWCQMVLWLKTSMSIQNFKFKIKPLYSGEYKNGVNTFISLNIGGSKSIRSVKDYFVRRCNNFVNHMNMIHFIV